MKKYILCLFILFIAIASSALVLNKKFNSNCSYARVGINHYTAPPFSLNQLQGHWVSARDDRWHWNINGRKLEELAYSDKGVDKTYYKIYFSNNLIDLDANFDEAKIDKTLESGKYLLTVEDDNLTIWCYELRNVSMTDGEKHLELLSTWSNRGYINFKGK